LLIKEGGKSGIWTNPDGLPNFLDNIFSSWRLNLNCLVLVEILVIKIT
jgi:hypothetical protein